MIRRPARTTGLTSATKVRLRARVLRPALSALPLVLVLAACGDPEPGADEGDTGGSGDSSGAASSSTGGAEGPVDPTTGAPDDTTGAPDTTAPPTTEDPDTTAPAGSTGDEPATTDAPATTTTTGETTDGDDTTGGDGTTGDILPDPGGELPTPSKPCPELEDGVVDIHPDGVGSPRAVRIWVDPEVAAVKDGPVVFYWHGTGGEPEEALAGVGDLGIQEILDMGGLVVAPTHDPGAGIFPWFLVLGQQQDDLLVADEVLACAEQQFGVDDARVHSLGFSAGGLHTAQMSVRRSNYLASVVTYSGGLIFNSMPGFADPDNDFAAMIFHGGPGDVVVVGFQQASMDYQAYLADNDSFSFLCDHGMGHNIPPEQDSVLQFFADHPWGTLPEPYLSGLPGGFPDYCKLP